MIKYAEKLNIEYIGIKDPKTPTEIEFEILGLETAIAEAKQKISVLKQSIVLAKLVLENDYNHSKKN